MDRWRGEVEYVEAEVDRKEGRLVKHIRLHLSQDQAKCFDKNRVHRPT